MPLVEAVPGFVRSGKVRDIFALDDERLLLVASDRISAFDVVLPTPIPDKGRVLTGHLALLVRRDRARRDHAQPPPLDVRRRPARRRTPRLPTSCAGASMICRRADVLPVELIVRGYLAGSGWKDYGRTGAVCGIPLPVRPARERPAAGADLHAVDQGRGGPRPEHLVRRDGGARRCRAWPRRRARRRSPCTASRPRMPRRPASSSPTPSSSSARSTMATLLLIDEVLTPDSSRFWDACALRAGPRPGLVRQAVRARLARGAATGTRRIPGRSCRPTSLAGTRRALCRRRSSASPAARSSDYLADDARRLMAELPLRRRHHAARRHPRSAGQGGRGRPAAAARRQRPRRARRAAGRADGRAPRARRLRARRWPRWPTSSWRTR